MDLEFLEFEYEMGMNKLEQMIVMNKLVPPAYTSQTNTHTLKTFEPQKISTSLRTEVIQIQSSKMPVIK